MHVCNRVVLSALYCYTTASNNVCVCVFASTVELQVQSEVQPEYSLLSCFVLPCLFIDLNNEDSADFIPICPLKLGYYFSQGWWGCLVYFKCVAMVLVLWGGLECLNWLSELDDVIWSHWVTWLFKGLILILSTAVFSLLSFLVVP